MYEFTGRANRVLELAKEFSILTLIKSLITDVGAFLIPTLTSVSPGE